MRLKNKIMKSVLAFAVLLTLVPLNNSFIHADDTEFETVVTEIDDANNGTGINQFTFSKEWTKDANPAAKNGTEHWTNKAGGDPGRWTDQPTVTLKFKGNKVELFGQKERTGGTYKAVIDGNEEEATEFSTYIAADKKPQESLYIKEGLSEDEHTLTLTILKTFDATAGANYKDVFVSGVIDYAKVTSLEVVDPDKLFETTVDNTDVTESNELFKYKFEGPGWVQGTGSSQFYKGTEAYANSADANKAFYTIKFLGSGVKVIASKNSGHADYDVFIDDVKVGEALAKLSSGSAQHHQTLFEKSDIAYGEHTLKIAAKAGSSGAIQADAVVIKHKAIPPTSITLDKEALSVEAGLSGEVSATLAPSYATGTIEYAIADTEIATISKTGEVEALKAGSTMIIAKVKGSSVSTSIPLTVTPEGAPVAVSVGNPNLLATQEHYNKVLTQALTTWSDVAWRGDILNSKVDLATKKALHNTTIISSDFTSGKNKIAKSNVEINWLKETTANIGRGNPGAPEKPFPDVIHKSASNELDIAKQRVQSAWININVPKNAKPGTYTGTITVSADEMEEPTILNYTFEVLDIVQPDPKDMDTQVQIWQHPFAVANYYKVAEEDYFEEAHLKYMRGSMEEYASLGGKDVVANIVEEAWGHQSYTGDPTMVQWIKKTDGTMDFNYDLFDKWIAFNIESGVLDPENGVGQIKCFSIVPWDDSFTYFDEATNKTVKIPSSAGSELWTSMWTQFLTNFMDHVEEKGWFDITYIALDERPYERVKHSVNLIKSIKNSEQKPFKISSAFNYESGEDYTFLDQIDDISIGLSHVDRNSDAMKKMSAHRKEKGLLTTIYTCTGDYPGNFTISEPSDNAWCMWYTMTQNTDGYMKWAWDNWVEDPLVNVNYKYWEPGDGWFIYPTEKGQESETYYYKTPRYEMLKQGTRDINKAKYIMQNSETLGQEVDDLVKSLKRPNGGGSYGSAVPATEADRLLPGTEVVRMRKGITDITRKYLNEINVPVTSIAVDKENISLVEGNTTTITATVLPENATDKTLTWKSSNDSVAIVNDGVITALKAGTATITVENAASGIKTDIKVTVRKNVINVESIALSSNEATLTVGDLATITATVLPENATDKTLTWKSSDNSVVTVNNGVITALKAGSATITVENAASGIKNEIKVTVKENGIIPEGKNEVTNTDGNVTAIGEFPSTVTLITRNLDKQEETELAKKATEKNKEFFAKNTIERILDITLQDGEVEYKPNGDIIVKIKLDKELLNKKLKVIHIADDGTIEILKSEVVDGHIVFVTNHFSKFAIVSEKAEKSPETGDNTNIAVWTMLALIAGGIFVCLKKRQRN